MKRIKATLYYDNLTYDSVISKFEELEYAMSTYIIGFEVYEGELNSKYVVAFDLIIEGETFKYCEEVYSIFRKKLREFYGLELKENYKAKLETL